MLKGLADKNDKESFKKTYSQMVGFEVDWRNQIFFQQTQQLDFLRLGLCNIEIF